MHVVWCIVRLGWEAVVNTEKIYKRALWKDVKAGDFFISVNVPHCGTILVLSHHGNKITWLHHKQNGSLDIRSYLNEGAESQKAIFFTSSEWYLRITL